MNVITRGIKNALRSPLRSGGIVLMLAISIGLILAMLVARSSVDQKITEVKAKSATKISINPAGVMGGMGGGDPLTADHVNKIKNTAHIASLSSTLTDQLGKDDTNLTASFEPGKIGQRMQRFEARSDAPTPSGATQDNISSEDAPVKMVFTPRTTITGTTDVNSVAANGSALKLTSGETIDAGSTELVALVGKNLAEKNNLKPGSTFTAYGKTFTVKGIYETGSMFQDHGLIIPLTTLQSATDQAGAVTSVTATVDSAENVSAAVDALKSSLGSAADITSQAEQASESVSSLESISSLALAGVIGATLAGAAIVLLAMVMIVRERRREIGVIKAIGGSNFKVIAQFMSEAMTLTAVGAIIGLAIGVAASGPMTQSLVKSSTDNPQAPRMISGGPGASGGGPRINFSPVQNSINQVTSTLTPQTFGIAIGITFLIAIIGSAVPAWLIARVRPAEVLRTE